MATLNKANETLFAYSLIFIACSCKNKSLRFFKFCFAKLFTFTIHIILTRRKMIAIAKSMHAPSQK